LEDAVAETTASCAAAMHGALRWPEPGFKVPPPLRDARRRTVHGVNVNC
jgi:hypothetical protein